MQQAFAQLSTATHESLLSHDINVSWTCGLALGRHATRKLTFGRTSVGYAQATARVATTDPNHTLRDTGYVHSGLRKQERPQAHTSLYNRS